MKPTNLNKETCHPISSNCVIWQGPDIPCIKLCKGDTVSDIVAKLGRELCDILDILDVSNYDLDCFNITACGPDNFQLLIQFLIDRICALENITPTLPGKSTGAACPDCLVTVAPCFATPSSNTMQLLDYVTLIGSRVCEIVLQVSTINSILIEYNTRITDLENQFPLVVPPILVTPSCVLPSVPTPIATVVTQLEQDFCNLQNATGIPSEIFTAIARQCSNLDSLTGPGSLTSLPEWATAANAAAAVNNIWLTLCDIRSAVLNIQANCCTTGCDAIEIGMTAEISGSDLILYFNGTVPAGWVECGPSVQQVTMVDCTGGTAIRTLNILPVLNDPSGYSIPLASLPTLNTACNISMTLVSCFRDPATSAECTQVTLFTLFNSVSCPTVTLASPTYDIIDYSINYIGIGTITVQVDLYDATGVTLITSDTYVGNVGPFTLLGQFIGLSALTTYKVKVTMITGAISTPCPWNNILTSNASLATLTTDPARTITNSGALSGGNILSDGGSAVINRGVCWSASPAPTILDSTTSDGSGVGLFSSTITGLLPSTTYYVRAYATNGVGTAYGNQEIFITLP